MRMEDAHTHQFLHEDWTVRVLGYEGSFSILVDKYLHLPSDMEDATKRLFDFRVDEVISSHMCNVKLLNDTEFHGVIKKGETFVIDFTFPKKPTSKQLERIKTTILKIVNAELFIQSHEFIIQSQKNKNA